MLYIIFLQTTEKLCYHFCQKEHKQENYFPCTHTPAVIGFLQYSIHKASQDLGVAKQKSSQSHSQIHGTLALT